MSGRARSKLRFCSKKAFAQGTAAAVGSRAMAAMHVCVRNRRQGCVLLLHYRRPAAKCIQPRVTDHPRRRLPPNPRCRPDRRVRRARPACEFACTTLCQQGASPPAATRWCTPRDPGACTSITQRAEDRGIWRKNGCGGKSVLQGDFGSGSACSRQISVHWAPSNLRDPVPPGRSLVRIRLLQAHFGSWTP